MLQLSQFPIQLLNHEQNTPEWHAARMGIPTASSFATVMAKGKGGGESLTRAKYLRQLAAERILGVPTPTWGGNEHTERGHEFEPDACELYHFLTDMEPVKVGFIRRGPVGGSPDRLVGDDGLLEIKTKLPHIHIELLQTNKLPSEHTAQCQGLLWVSDRQWVDFMSYWPGLPAFRTRVHRDPIYMATLSKAVSEFLSELDDLTASIQAMNKKAA